MPCHIYSFTSSVIITNVTVSAVLGTWDTVFFTTKSLLVRKSQLSEETQPEQAYAHRVSKVICVIPGEKQKQKQTNKKLH